LTQPPSTPSKTDSNQPGTHHRHRRVHYHRHHHRHLTKQRPLGADSLETLALLATQVMSREPLVISRKGQNTAATTATTATTTTAIVTPNVAPGDEYPSQSEKKRYAPEERDKGLQLRPVKRVELATIDIEEQSISQGQASKRESALRPLPNGRGSTDGASKKPAHPAFVQGANHQSTKPGISSTKDLVGRSSSKHRRP